MAGSAGMLAVGEAARVAVAEPPAGLAMCRYRARVRCQVYSAPVVRLARTVDAGITAPAGTIRRARPYRAGPRDGARAGRPPH